MTTPERARDAARTGRDLDAWFTEAYAAHRVALRRYLLHLGADEHTAHDVLADAMINVWRRLHATGTVPDNPRAYLKRVAHNAYVDHCRRLRNREQLVADPAGDLGPAVEAVEEWVGVEHVKEAVARLTPAQQRVVTLAALGMTVADIAVELGLPSAGAAAVALHRARRALRSELGTNRTTAPPTGFEPALPP